MSLWGGTFGSGERRRLRSRSITRIFRDALVGLDRDDATLSPSGGRFLCSLNNPLYTVKGSIILLNRKD